MLLVDTNVWLSAADRRSGRHEECTAVLGDHAGELAAPVPVIAETAWLLLDRGGAVAQQRFVALITGGRLEPVELTADDWRRVGALIERYADLELDVVDASMIAVAERYRLTRIATLDHRDFGVVRPAHVDALDLIP